MKRFFILAVIAVFSLGLFLVSCTGPEGPAGKNGTDGAAGTNGVDGKNGTAPCQTCHGDKNVDLKFAQYSNSKHGTGIIFTEEYGRPQCGACHTGTGYAEAIALNKDDPQTASAGPINCIACHDIHDTYSVTDFKLRQTAPITLRQSAVSVDFGGNANTCARCHQARNYVRSASWIASGYDTVNASAGNTYSRFGPHYGVIANVLSNQGLEDIGAGTPDANKHATLPKGCISCHMAKDTIATGYGGHTFVVPFANMKEIPECANAQCHPGVTTVANYPNTKQNGKDIAAIRRKLIDVGLLDTTQAMSAEGYNVLGEYFRAPATGNKIGVRADSSKVVLNYLFIAKDKSNGVHNPDLVRKMIAKMKSFLGL